MIDTDTGQMSNSNEFGQRMHDEAIKRGEDQDAITVGLSHPRGSAEYQSALVKLYDISNQQAAERGYVANYNPASPSPMGVTPPSLYGGQNGAYKSPGAAYQHPSQQTPIQQPKNIFDTAIPGLQQDQNPLLQNNGASSVPTWKPPAQMPQQDQGQLFQGNNQAGGLSVPSWQPPTQQNNPPYGQINPSMGSMNPIQQRNQPSRYQSPSSRYVRNQGTF